MPSPLPRPSPRWRRFIALAPGTVLVAALMTAAASPAAAASIRRTWASNLGAGSTATLTSYWGGNGALDVHFVGLKPSTKYPIIVYRGSCATATKITGLPGAVTDASGAVSKTSAVSTAIMNSVWAYARTTSIAIKVGTGSTARCGALRFTVATRIAIPGLAIDLPVVKSPSGYPLCNVAMYLKELAQPGEAGVSFIYAHARKGMFLPLLDRSKVNNGEGLIGMAIRVWTSNNVVTTYEITQVRRHATSFGNAFSLETPQLWLQTSEGPRGTKAKLIIVAKLIGQEAATRAAANPTPHPVVCH